jgi:uncharacterized protein (TIGR03083 family)
MDTWDEMDAERTAFADLTDELTPEQWEAPSLCTAWKVREVVAHVNQVAELKWGEAIVKTLRYGGRVDTMLAKEAVKRGAQPTDELRTGLRATVGNRHTPPRTDVEGHLADLVIHHQDVRRPLRMSRTIPPERLRLLLDRLVGIKYFRKAARGRTSVRLRATDLDWQHGDGLEVTGTGEAILMAFSGRLDALQDLGGPGVEHAKERFDA